MDGRQDASRGRGGRGSGRRQWSARPVPGNAYVIPNYRWALESALTFAISQDALLTAYNVINSIRNEDPILIKTLSLYAPRGADVNAFVQQLLNVIRDGGLEGSEVFARPAETNGVALIQFVDNSLPSQAFVLVTVSQFPTLPPATEDMAIDDITWSVPVTSCDKTWHPNQLLPYLQDKAFAVNPKLQTMYSYAIQDRQAAGFSLPDERSTKLEEALTVHVDPVPSVSAYAQSIDALCLCDKAWDVLTEFSEYLIQFESIPFDKFRLPGYEAGFNAMPVMHLHHTARQVATPGHNALDKYIAASKVSMTHRMGLWTLLTMPFFLENNPYRASALESPYHAPF